jgi:hypothetical protein
MLTLYDGEPPETIHSPCPLSATPILDRQRGDRVVALHPWDPNSALRRRCSRQVATQSEVWMTGKASNLSIARVCPARSSFAPANSAGSIVS